MLLSEIFDQLSHGELAQLSMADNDGAGILSDSYPAVVAHLNLALTALYKIFPLLIKEAIIQEYQAINIYYLDSKYAVNGGSTEPVKYLVDTAQEPFTNTVFKVEKVYDELGKEIFLNDTNEPTSIMTPTYNSLQIPNPTDTAMISVMYRADHVPINIVGLTDPSLVDVPIPPSLLEPLLFYVASRAYASVSMVDGINQSAGYLNKFEASVQRIKTLGLVKNERTLNNKLELNGWV